MCALRWTVIDSLINCCDLYVDSGLRRASPTSSKVLIGVRMSCATSPTTMSTTGCGHRSSNAKMPTESISRSNSVCETAICFQVTYSNKHLYYLDMANGRGRGARKNLLATQFF